MATTRTRTMRAAKGAGLTFADVRARIQRPQRITELVLDAAAAAQIEALTELLERAQARDEATGSVTAPQIARQLVDAEARADASRVAFTFTAIPHTQYKQLQTQYPATAEQLAEQAASGGEQWSFDPDAFAPVLVRAQLTDPLPPDDDEEWAAFWDALSDGQMRNLWLTAVSVQMQVTTIGPRNAQAASLLARP